jgi:hypothetical protein
LTKGFDLLSRDRFDFRAMDISWRGLSQGHNPELDLTFVDWRNE